MFDFSIEAKPGHISVRTWFGGRAYEGFIVIYVSVIWERHTLDTRTDYFQVNFSEILYA